MFKYEEEYTSIGIYSDTSSSTVSICVRFRAYLNFLNMATTQICSLRPPISKTLMQRSRDRKKSWQGDPYQGSWVPIGENEHRLISSPCLELLNFIVPVFCCCRECLESVSLRAQVTVAMQRAHMAEAEARTLNIRAGAAEEEAQRLMREFNR